MKTKRPTIGERAIAGAMDALAHAKGLPSGVIVHHPPVEVNVKAIRQRTGLSQSKFAQRFGFSLDSIQNWEAKRRRPEGPARTLLLIIDRAPEAVEQALER